MDIKSGDMLAEIPVGVEPEGMGVSPDCKFTVATSESTSMAHVIDNASQKAGRQRAGRQPSARGEIHPDGNEVWVSSEVGGTISVIDPKTWKVKKKISFEVPGVRPELLQPVGMEFTKDGKEVFVALGPGNRVAVIDTATKAVKNYILVGQRPWHGEISPGRQEILCGQRPDQRFDRHRRGAAKGREVGAGRAAALGRRHQAVARSRQR